MPDRLLSRPLYPHEVRAAVDWGSADANWQQQRDQLVGAVKGPQMQQIDDLHDQLVEADNDLSKIGEIQAPALLEDIIFTHMSNIAVMGAHDAQQEAARQGHTVQLPDLTALSDSQRERAKVVDQFLADTLTNSAKSSAFVYTGGSLSGKEIADKVKDDLINLSTSFLNDQLGGALTAAMNAGRKATIGLAMSKAGQPVHASKGKRIMAQAANPAVTIYASEVLDGNTCDPCESIDGTQYISMDDADSDYPSGGYYDCDGMTRCRGTIVAVYDEVPISEPVEPITPPSEIPETEPYRQGPAQAPTLQTVTKSDVADEEDDLVDELKYHFPDVPVKGNIGEHTTLDDQQMADVGQALADMNKVWPELTDAQRPLTEITFSSSPKLTGAAKAARARAIQGATAGAKAMTYYKSDVSSGLQINDLIHSVEDMEIPQGPVQSTYDMTVHETGHIWANVHGTRDIQMLARMEDVGLEFDDFAQVSNYALVNSDEAFAETWAAKYGSTDVWERLPQEFKDKYDRLVKLVSQMDKLGKVQPFGVKPMVLQPGSPLYKEAMAAAEVNKAAGKWGVGQTPLMNQMQKALGTPTEENK